MIALGPLLYPPGSPLPDISDDPLVKLIACIGRDLLVGVTSHDEPVGTGVDLQDVANLYNRVKEVEIDLFHSIYVVG